MIAHHQGKAGARKKDKGVAYNQDPVITYYQDPTDASNLGLMGDYGQGQTGGCDLSYADSWNQYQMAGWNQNEMSAHNLNPIGTHHRGQTGAHDPSLVDISGQGQTGAHHPSGLDDLTTMFQFSKPIRTRGNQSPHSSQVHDEFHSVTPYRREFRNPNVQEDTTVLNTARLANVKLPKNPRSRSKRKEK